jgi:hypothetical protein
MKKQFTSTKMLFLSLFLSATTNSFSAPVKSETAQTVAVNFIKQRTGEVKTVSKVVAEEYKGKTSVYGISFEGGGWVIVSSKDEMWPILAYNTTGEYIPGKESSNEVFHDFLNTYGMVSAAIDSLKNAPVSSSSTSATRSGFGDETNSEEFSKAQNKWKSLLNSSNLRSYTAGTKLLMDNVRGENQWDQSTDQNGQLIYNNDCPTDPNNGNCRTLVGCPAISLSQVMWKWRWPEFAEISQGAYLKSENQGRKFFQKPAKLLRGTTCYTGFDWDLIPAKLLKSSTPTAQINETTRLLRLAGEAIHVSYGCDGTGINDLEAYDLYPHAYKDMGYNCYGNIISQYILYEGTESGVQYSNFFEDILSWTDEQWNQLIKTEIDAERPVNYCNFGFHKKYYNYYSQKYPEFIDEIGIGHTYVISGYERDDDAYHFYCNMGWGGSSDGYYHIYRSTLIFGPWEDDKDIYGFVHSATVGVSPKYPTVSGNICLDYKKVNAGETKGKNAKENIVVPCDNKFDVYSNGTLKLRAGKSIKFKAGFIAHSGASLSAKIIPEFSNNHAITASVSTISSGANGKLEFNVANTNSCYLTIRDANGNVLTRNSKYIPSNGKIVVWNGASNVSNNCKFEVTFLNNYGQIDTYSGKFSSKTLTKMSKPTIEDPIDYVDGIERNNNYYAFAMNNNGYNILDEETATSSQNLYIYPNPTNGIVYIKASEETINSITVSNMTGKVLVEKTVNADQAEIDLSSYNKGIYLVKVVTENDSYIEKVVLK